MTPLFSSERLYFRRFLAEDAESLFLLNSDPDVIKYTGDPPFESIDSAHRFIAEYDHYKKHGFGRWAVLKKEDNKFIGWCGLKYNEENDIDIGFRFFQNEWGKGYASEAAKATIEYGANNLSIQRIIGRAAKQNIASLRILEKLGFTYVKKSPCHGIEEALYFVYIIDN